MHTKEARAFGETEQRLYALNGWRETPFFSHRERAALEWVEAIRRVPDTHVPDEVYGRVRRHIDEAQLVALTFAAAAINAFNRLAIALVRRGVARDWHDHVVRQRRGSIARGPSHCSGVNAVLRRRRAARRLGNSRRPLQCAEMNSGRVQPGADRRIRVSRDLWA
jgi:Carboxymuconolactone decarboxylase family